MRFITLLILCITFPSPQGCSARTLKVRQIDSVCELKYEMYIANEQYVTEQLSYLPAANQSVLDSIRRAHSQVAAHCHAFLGCDECREWRFAHPNQSAMIFTREEQSKLAEHKFDLIG